MDKVGDFTFPFGRRVLSLGLWSCTLRRTTHYKYPSTETGCGALAGLVVEVKVRSGSGGRTQEKRKKRGEGGGNDCKST